MSPSSNKSLMRLAQRVVDQTLESDRPFKVAYQIVGRYLTRHIDTMKAGWVEGFVRLRKQLKALDEGDRSITFVKQGNSKLPFWFFNSLPIITCPGAGDCADYCYSLRAWRYPTAFCGQLLNTIAMRHIPNVVMQQVLAVPEGGYFRLYTDGDFASIDDVYHWMDTIKKRKDVTFYGYSKSWDLLREYGRNNTWPSNLKLNCSSGGSGQYTTAEEFLSWPVSRGQFVGVSVYGQGLPKGTSRYDVADYHRAVRKELTVISDSKVFSCPGQCGECTSAGPACASDRFSGVTIGIGIH